MSSEKPPARLPSTDELLEIAQLVRRLADEAGIRIALLGGLALQLHGSPRLTGDVDFVADAPAPPSPQLAPDHPLSFGGMAYTTPAGIGVDWITREDDYRALYEEALARALPIQGVPGLSMAPPEYLAAMKLVTLRPTDYEDLMFLLGRPGLVLPESAREIVYRLVGGRFARDQLDLAFEEARWRAGREQPS